MSTTGPEAYEPVFPTPMAVVEASATAAEIFDHSPAVVMDLLGAPHAVARHISRGGVVLTRTWQLCPGSVLKVGTLSEQIQGAAIFCDEEFLPTEPSLDRRVRWSFRIAGFDSTDPPSQVIEKDDGTVHWPQWNGFQVRLVPEIWMIFLSRPRGPGGGKEEWELFERLRAA